jgi:hypothetical protein
MALWWEFEGKALMIDIPLKNLSKSEEPPLAP